MINFPIIFPILLFFFQNFQMITSCCIPVKIVIDVEKWGEEISWETDPPSEAYSFGPYQDNTLYEHEFCLPPNTTYTFVAKDSFGDGWNGGRYFVYLNETRVLGPTTFAHGFVFAEEQFTTCACSCSLDCLSLQKSCCVSDDQCGQCLPGFFSIEEKCEKIDLNSPELGTWQLLFNKYGGMKWSGCNSEAAFHDPCEECRRVRCVINGTEYTIHVISLNALDLSGTIPIEIFQFKNLRGLDLSENRFSGTIPEEVGYLTELQGLSLFLNDLVGSLPEKLFELKNLEIFGADTNHFNGTISNRISQLQKLQILELGSNELSGTIPLEVFELSHLQRLYLYSNLLVGTIPTEMSQMLNLEELYLYSNQLNGPIPQEISQLVHLKRLYLYSNKLSGTIPPQIGNLTDLIELYLSVNQLNGTIPHQVATLRNLQSLSFSSNQLSGSIPTELFDLINLKRLDLFKNTFSGEIHPKIGRLNKLEILNLHSNLFYGTLPMEIGNLTSLKRLIIHSNNFTGTLPRHIALLENLEWFEVYSNNFYGAISEEYANLKMLKFFVFHHNQFNGSIPQFLSTLDHLQQIDISYNNFSGSLPQNWNDRYFFWGQLNAKNNEESPFFQSLRLFKACCNYLTGELRDFVSPFITVNNLVQLDLSNNGIMGSFQFSSWNGIWFQFGFQGFQHNGFSSLAFFDLSCNELHGHLPTSLPLALTIMFVSDNKLTSSIPDSFSQLLVFISKNNNLRSNRLPSFLRSIPFSHIEIATGQYNGTVECSQLETVDGSSKVFDLEPAYDNFGQCQCKAGYFNFQYVTQVDPIFVHCDSAPKGHYVPSGNRLSQPLKCPAGTYADGITNTLCKECISNTFSLSGESRCHPCLSRMDCNHGIVSLKPNKWISPNTMLNVDTKEDDIYDCFNRVACVKHGSSMRCAWEFGYDNTSVLCSECLEGYYSSDRLTKTCKECTKSTTVASFVFGMFILVVGILFIIKKIMRRQRAAKLSTSAMLEVMQHQSSDKKGLLRVLVGHIQMLLILSDLQMRGPQLLHTIMDTASQSLIPSLSPSAIKCTLHISFETSVIITFAAPIFLIIFLFFLVVSVSTMLRTPIKISIRSMFSVFVFVFYLIHPSIMKTLIQVFHFHNETIQGEMHLLSDMFITKSSPQYSYVFTTALIGVLLYGFFAPLFVAFMLKKRSTKFKDGVSLLYDPIFEEEFGFLYLGYKTTGFLYLWELLIYFRKTLLLMLSVFSGHNKFLQAYMATIILVIAQLLHNKFNPYRSPRLNRVETKSLSVLGVTQMFMLFSSQYIGENDSQAYSIPLTILIILMNATVFWGIVWLIVKDTQLVYMISNSKLIKKLISFCNPSARVLPSMNTEKNSQSIEWFPLIHQAQKVTNMLIKINENGDDKKENITNLIQASMEFLQQLQEKCALVDNTISRDDQNRKEQTSFQESSGNLRTTKLENNKEEHTFLSKSTKRSNEWIEDQELIECISTHCVGRKLHTLWHTLSSLSLVLTIPEKKSHFEYETEKPTHKAHKVSESNKVDTDTANAVT